MSWQLAMLIGVLIGANVGVFVAGLCFSAKDGDEPGGEQRERAGDQEIHGEVVAFHRPV